MSWWDEWLDIRVIKVLSQHASATLASMLLFAIVAKALKLLSVPGVVRTIIETIEYVVLIGLVIWFVWQMALVLWKGRVRGEFRSFLVAA
jgi:chromate transport protein ChrA